MTFPKKGLYAITLTENRTDATILSQAKAALEGGAVVLQYRDKRLSKPTRLAEKLLPLCHHYHVPLIINDDIELADQLGADGVHLGRDDGNIQLAREKLGDNAIIGISCYNDLNKAITMQTVGADYVAFGRFFPSTTKPLASPAQLDTLQQAKQRLTIPIIAIGGILPENGASLLQAGADLLAVIGGVFNQDDPKQAAQQYQQLF
jgi:thiamine-phosphate pyrophosphorylase